MITFCSNLKEKEICIEQTTVKNRCCLQIESNAYRMQNFRAPKQLELISNFLTGILSHLSEFFVCLRVTKSPPLLEVANLWSNGVNFFTGRLVPRPIRVG